MLDEKGLKIVIEGYVRAVDAGTAEKAAEMNVNYVINRIADYDTAYKTRQCLLDAAPPHKKDWPRKLVALKDMFDWKLLALLAHDIALIYPNEIAENWADDLIRRYNPESEEEQTGMA
jgi:hypothetical protein